MSDKLRKAEVELAVLQKQVAKMRDSPEREELFAKIQAKSIEAHYLRNPVIFIDPWSTQV